MSLDGSPTLDWRTIGHELSNWRRWGSRDALGTLNLIGPDQLRGAAQLVRKGIAFDLGIPLDRDGPQDGKERTNPLHLMSVVGGREPEGGAFRFHDDYIVMPLQAGTQWDALSHVYYDDRMYNDVPSAAVDHAGAHQLGVETLAKGIVGRAVLLDVARHQGRPWLDPGEPIEPEHLDAVVADENVEIRSGDILLVRTGWYEKYLSHRQRATFLGPEPGLGLESCRWLRQRDVAAVACDNWAVEAIPSPLDGEPFPVHMVLIRDMGMILGEMFDLRALSVDCAADGVFEMFLSAPVLKVTAAVGSPINPIALK